MLKRRILLFLSLSTILIALSACTSTMAPPDMPPLTAITPAAVQVEADATPLVQALDEDDSAEIAQPVFENDPDAPWKIALADHVPQALGHTIAESDAFSWATDGNADVNISFDGAGTVVGEQLFAVVAAFATVTDTVATDDLQQLWLSGDTAPYSGAPLTDSETPLYASPEAVAALSPRWGAPGIHVFQAVPDAIRELLWENRNALAIIPFHELTPDLKVLAVDNISPLYVGSEAYPLTIPITAVGDATAIAEIDASVPFFTNRDTTKLTHVAMTGVTALVRATASQMENYGITWPGEEVADLLRSADIAHISNEVSFDADCPYPNPIGGTSFCSDDRYIELLEFIGTDVIELTGNHLNDYGLDNLGRSMELYASKGWQTFGGGRDLAEASKPLIIEHNGNTIAFVGCNSFGPVYAWAGDDSAGSNPCDGSLEGQIAQLSAENDVVIATLQYAEFYHYAPTADQIVDFRALAEAGADAVSGSQGHHAQGFDFYNDAFIHYGLGNLFFDQMDMLGTRQTFIDNYFIYDGKLISVDLYTGLIENYARPRTMTPEERAQALESLFQASGW